MATFDPPVANSKMKGPTRTSNYVVADRLLMGDDPASGKLDKLVNAGVTLFVDLRDVGSATNYVKTAGVAGVDYVAFPFHVEDFGARRKHMQFLYALVDAVHAGEKVYIHDASGHGTCGVVGACALAILHGWSGMKSLNMIAQLHEVRDNTEGSDCPVDARSKDMKAYVREVVRELSYAPGTAPPLREGGGAVEEAKPAAPAVPSPTRFGASSRGVGGGESTVNILGESTANTTPSSAARFAHSRGRHGGGATSINIFGGTTSTPQPPAPTTPDVKHGQAKSSGGGQSSVNIFNDGTLRASHASPSVAAHHSPTAAHPPAQAPQTPPSPPRDLRDAMAVTITRPSADIPWGFAVDGLELVSVGPGTPAEACGLPLGVIVAIAGEAVHTDADLGKLARAEESVTLHVLPNTPVSLVHYHLRREAGQSWGLDVDDLWVVGVIPGSPADEAGVRCGRLIAINGAELHSMEECCVLGELDTVIITVLPDAQAARPQPPATADSPPRSIDRANRPGPLNAAHVECATDAVAPAPLPEPFNTRDKADLATAQGPTRNTNWAIRGRLLCGPSPDLFKTGDVKVLADTGVTCVVNLCIGEGKTPAYIPTLEKHAARKIDFVPFFVVDGSVPEKAQIEGFVSLVRDIVAKLRAGHVVYVHCKGGHGRTGMVVACVLATIFDLPHMKALNQTDTLHSTRKDTEDQCSPQTQEQRIFVLETLKKMAQE
eukprot:TRINITY_DN1268_c0_g2_i1.p1 TRINITY_DN1268_c0_g2~~TRINITY_DN1268_c0_g2_i1.p1  ORF type:complete len:717 (+),score=232.49 TRINITY_DN1268_c0_g2_i1:69-2219(+)